MNVEEHIRECILDQDHLADIVIGYESHVAAIQARVVELLDLGLVELYTYSTEQNGPVVLSKSNALAIARELQNWAWLSPSRQPQQYFLCPVKLADGRLAYGI